MTGLRSIPIPPLGHTSACRICAAVDRYYANRRRPAARSGLHKAASQSAGARIGSPEVASPPEAASAG